MILKVTDKLHKRSVEISCNLRIDSIGFEKKFNDFVRSKKIRTQIIDELKLYFGDAKIELINSNNEVVAIGTFEFNAFSGHGNVETRRCIPYTL